MELKKSDLPSLLAIGVRRIIATGCPPLPEIIKVSQPGWSHVHQEREIFFQLQGKVDYMLAGNYYHVVPGDAVFIDAGEEHTYYFGQCERNIRQFWVSLERKQIRTIAIGMDAAGKIGHDFFYTTDNTPLCRILQSTWDSVYSGDFKNTPWQKKALQTAFELLLCDVVRSTMNDAPRHAQIKKENILAFLRDYINDNHGNDCGLARLEKITGYSRYHLSHLYRRHCGKTIKEAVDEARMRYLATQSGNANVKDIAEKLGFSSVANFRRWQRNNGDYWARDDRDLETVIRHQHSNR